MKIWRRFKERTPVRARKLVSPGAVIASSLAVGRGWHDFLVWLYGFESFQWAAELATVPGYWPGAVVLLGGFAAVYFFKTISLKKKLEPKLSIESVGCPIFRTQDLHRTPRFFKCEIRIKNNSLTEPARGVNIVIKKFDDNAPFDLFHPPQTVFPKEEKINPQDSKAWTIADGSQYGLGDTVSLDFKVQVHGEPYQSTANRIELTIMASSENAGSVARDFVLLRDSEQRPLLVPVDELDKAELGEPDGAG